MPVTLKSNESDLNNPKKYVNKSWDALSKDDDALIEFTEGEGYDLENVDKDDVASHIRDSEFFHELGDTFMAMGNIVYPTCENPTDNDLVKIASATTDVAILCDDNGNNFITPTACGTNLNLQIAYAFMVVDGHVPQDLDLPPQNLGLKEEDYNELMGFMSPEPGMG